ncbi:hypothetical protein AKJ18_08830 [Vibrio xuii]|nr:hypothetical protein AKJ18_08830 [Vibrio xuii]
MRAVTLNGALSGLIYQTMKQGAVSIRTMKLFHGMVKAYPQRDIFRIDEIEILIGFRNKKRATKSRLK